MKKKELKKIIQELKKENRELRFKIGSLEMDDQMRRDMNKPYRWTEISPYDITFKGMI